VDYYEKITCLRSPILQDYQLLKEKISFFSGILLDVDRGLNGFCDFIISKSPEQFYLNAPIITIVEAKGENITGGLGQCIAEMFASSIFNDKEGEPLPKIYGAVTTGNTWRFLEYQDNTAFIDLVEYHITNVNKIVGILAEMINENASPTSQEDSKMAVPAGINPRATKASDQQDVE
jgi:hypothetical protein